MINARWLRSSASIVIVMGLIAATAGIAYQSISLARDRRNNPMPGRRIDLGGYKLHILCQGTGSPGVILDSGLGDGYTSWRKVQPQIAQFTRVCTYDRGGFGYSDNSPNPRTSGIFAKELHSLLQNAGIAPPYVLAGHSMGGLDVRIYAGLYPDDVAGMVLVDSSHPDQKKRFPQALNDMDGMWLRDQEFLTAIMPFGIPRLMGFCAREPEVRAAECNFRSDLENLRELKAFPESAAQTSSSGSLGAMPLAVLSSDPDRPEPDLPEDLVEPTHRAWQQMQLELSRLSSRGTLTVAKNSGHCIQLDRPDVVISGVREVVDEARSQHMEIRR